MNGLSKLFSTKEHVIGLHCHFISSDNVKINLVLLTREGEEIKHQWSKAFESFVELTSFDLINYPIALVLTGKGILSKYLGFLSRMK